MARIRKSQADENFTSQKVIWYIALYIRLSKDDGNDESLSVTNQRKILRSYVEDFFEGGYVIHREYIEMKIPKMIQFENMNPPRKRRNKGFRHIKCFRKPLFFCALEKL